MSRRVLFRPEARTEYALAWQWYEDEREGLGAEMVGCVDATIASVARDPLLHLKVFGEVRRALVRRFPYAVFFVVDADTVLILAVAHAHREPGYWLERT